MMETVQHIRWIEDRKHGDEHDWAALMQVFDDLDLSEQWLKVINSCFAHHQLNTMRWGKKGMKGLEKSRVMIFSTVSEADWYDEWRYDEQKTETYWLKSYGLWWADLLLPFAFQCLIPWRAEHFMLLSLEEYHRQGSCRLIDRIINTRASISHQLSNRLKWRLL